jgi:hypothetical protein
MVFLGAKALFQIYDFNAALKRCSSTVYKSVGAAEAAPLQIKT